MRTSDEDITNCGTAVSGRLAKLKAQSGILLAEVKTAIGVCEIMRNPTVSENSKADAMKALDGVLKDLRELECSIVTD